MKPWLDDLTAHATGLRLRSGIPLLIVGFALVVSLVVTLRHAAEEARKVEAAGLDLMAQRAIRLQSMLETYYRNRLDDSAQDALAQTGAQRGHRLAAVIDENGRVVAASRSRVLREPAEAALPGLVRDAGLLAEGGKVHRQRSGSVRLGAGGDSVAALFPLSFDAGKRSLGQERVGLLFIEYDLAERKAAARAEAQVAAFKLTAAIVLLALLLWLLLHVLLTRRMRRIVAAVQRVGNADFSARTGIGGRDEIADIARAFDAMTSSLADARDRLDEALDAAQMYTWSFDVPSQILVFRRPTDRLASRRAGEAIPQRTFLGRVHPDDRAVLETAWRETAAGGVPFRVEYRVAERAGGWRWLASRGSRRRRDGAGRTLTLAGLAWDIDEAKQAELELARHREHLEELVAARTEALRFANQELEAFSYSASHDLQAPLRSMRGFAEIVLEDYGGRLDEQGRSHLQRIVRAGSRMSRMIEDLLAFSRSARGALHRSEVNLSELAEEIAADLRARDPARRISWRIAPDIVADGDRSLLSSVLANLLGNAWKYSRERELAEIAFEARAQDGGTAYCVRDNGVGFDMQHAEKIFQPFQRLHSQDRFEGSGIGLSTAARIIHRHGGRIWAEARPEGGALFCFTLGVSGRPGGNPATTPADEAPARDGPPAPS